MADILQTKFNEFSLRDFDDLIKSITICFSGLNNLMIQASIGSGNAGLILGLRPANERCHYFVTASLIGWAQT